MLGYLTTRNPTTWHRKAKKFYVGLKVPKTSITPLLAADSLNSKWASLSSPGDDLSKGRIFFSKYLSHIKVTIEPESMRDRTPLPWMSKVTDGQVDTALCITLCFVSSDTELLTRVWNISSNWLLGVNGRAGSTFAPPM